MVLRPEVSFGLTSKETISPSACPCCLSESWTNSLSTRAGWVFFCSGCGIGRLEEIDNHKIFEKFEKEPEQVKLEVDRYVAGESARRSSARYLLEKLDHCGNFSGSVALLEFGSHVGFLLAEARERSWQVEGVDPNHVAVEWGRKNLSLESLQIGTLEEFSLEERRERYDVVVMANLLGHLEGPDKAVAKCFELLRPGGFLVIQTPNLDNFFLSLPSAWQGHWRYFISTYFWYFNTSGLQKLFERTGFELVHQSQSRRPITLGFAADRLLALLEANVSEQEPKTSLARDSLSHLRESKLGGLSVNTDFLGDSIDAMGYKPLF